MQSEAMIGRVDDETVRLLVGSISYLVSICEENNLDVDFNNFPHCNKLKASQIEQLKHIMKD